jgi:16S rRNA processing protein RimM
MKGVERRYEVEETGGTPASFVMKFRGVGTPEAAKLLAGAEIVVPRDGAAPLAEDEFYIEDLRGIRVILGTGEGSAEVVGSIVDVVDGGGGQLLEVRLNDGSSRLLPFRNEFFGDIDLSAGTAVLRERWMLE